MLAFSDMIRRVSEYSLYLFWRTLTRAFMSRAPSGCHKLATLWPCVLAFRRDFRTNRMLSNELPFWKPCGQTRRRFGEARYDKSMFETDQKSARCTWTYRLLSYIHATADLVYILMPLELTMMRGSTTQLSTEYPVHHTRVGTHAAPVRP